MIEEQQRLTQILKQNNIDPAQIDDLSKQILAELSRQKEGQIENNLIQMQDQATQFNYLEEQDLNQDNQVQDEQDEVENVVQNLANQQIADDNLLTDSDPEGDDHREERGTWAYFLFSPKSSLNREFFKFRTTMVGSIFSLNYFFVYRENLQNYTEKSNNNFQLVKKDIKEQIRRKRLVKAIRQLIYIKKPLKKPYKSRFDYDLIFIVDLLNVISIQWLMTIYYIIQLYIQKLTVSQTYDYSYKQIMFQIQLQFLLNNEKYFRLSIKVKSSIRPNAWP
ncbi:hypothetical protein pb186bvf_020251 [Paramecium bursaria]